MNPNEVAFIQFNYTSLRGLVFANVYDMFHMHTWYIRSKQRHILYNKWISSSNLKIMSTYDDEKHAGNTHWCCCFICKSTMNIIIVMIKLPAFVWFSTVENCLALNLKRAMNTSSIFFNLSLNQNELCASSNFSFKDFTTNA